MSVEKISLPDLGGVDKVIVIEVLVKPGDTIKADEPMIVVESEKASMEIPCPQTGVVEKVCMAVDDEVSEGQTVVWLAVDTGLFQDKKVDDSERTSVTSLAESEPFNQTASGVVASHESASDLPVSESSAEVEGWSNHQLVKSVVSTMSDESSPHDSVHSSVKGDLQYKSQEPASQSTQVKRNGYDPVDHESKVSVYASPSVRRLARALDLDLSKIKGSGDKGRIRRSDVFTVIQQRMQSSHWDGQQRISVSSWDDPSKYGPVTLKALNKIKVVTSRRLTESWQTIPHVTQFDKVDVTELEQLRNQVKSDFKERGLRLTLLAFLIKSLATALKHHPQMNAAYDQQSQSLVLRNYCNLGIAVDTPHGLVVPVIRDVWNLSIEAISSELQRLSLSAREGQLLPREMMGGSMSISSLGGIGGEYFTPIINPPQVAILGVSKASVQPVYQDQCSDFRPRLMLPLSLSYDHRVIDGAEAMRFLQDLMDILTQYPKQLTLQALSN